MVVIPHPSGAFTANADGSLVMATHPIIGSEFNDLENSSWLFIGFMLAGCATQAVVCVRRLRLRDNIADCPKVREVK
jgi:uncharacterized membrane protein YoaK (UPF0700 family)